MIDAENEWLFLWIFFLYKAMESMLLQSSFIVFQDFLFASKQTIFPNKASVLQALYKAAG